MCCALPVSRRCGMAWSVVVAPISCVQTFDLFQRASTTACNCAPRLPGLLAITGTMPRFSVVFKLVVLPALAISAIIWVGIANKAKVQSASSGTSNPVMDMSAADVKAFLREQGLQSLVDKVPDDMDGPALLEFVKWHETMPVGVRAKSGDNNEYWNQLSRAVKTLSSKPPKTFWEWHSHNVRLSEMW